MNYYDFKDLVGRNMSYAQWYRDPNTTSYSDINEYEYNQIFTAMSMFNLWLWTANNTNYYSVYYAYQEKPMFVQYPAFKESFWNWTDTDDECEYFESLKMDYYDAR